MQHYIMNVTRRSGKIDDGTAWRQPERNALRSVGAESGH
jgi:hypothetical protein